MGSISGKAMTIHLTLNMIARNSGKIKTFGMDNLLEEQIIKQDIGVIFDEILFVDS
jgi:ABC-type multidrug transport system, ATPase component